MFLLLPRIHHLYPENSSKTHQIIPPKGSDLRTWSTFGSKKNVPERIDHIPLYQSLCVVEWSQLKGLGESVCVFFFNKWQRLELGKYREIKMYCFAQVLIIKYIPAHYGTSFCEISGSNTD